MGERLGQIRFIHFFSKYEILRNKILSNNLPLKDKHLYRQNYGYSN